MMVPRVIILAKFHCSCPYKGHTQGRVDCIMPLLPTLDGMTVINVIKFYLCHLCLTALLNGSTMVHVSLCINKILHTRHRVDDI